MDDIPSPSGAPVVHLVDGDSSSLRTLARLLAADGHAVQTFQSATDFLEHRQPDARGCLVTALEMPGKSGLELQTALKAQANPLPVIFLTGHGTIEASVHAMKEGAVDFLTKPVKERRLSEAVREALTRDAEMFAARMREAELRARFASLTRRERQVLDRIVAGELNKEIATSLGTTERTVKAHRAHIMAKVQAHSAAELGNLARQLSGLLGS